MGRASTKHPLDQYHSASVCSAMDAGWDPAFFIINTRLGGPCGHAMTARRCSCMLAGSANTCVSEDEVEQCSDQLRDIQMDT